MLNVNHPGHAKQLPHRRNGKWIEVTAFCQPADRELKPCNVLEPLTWFTAPICEQMTRLGVAVNVLSVAKIREVVEEDRTVGTEC